jgi:hypothetical protein
VLGVSAVGKRMVELGIRETARVMGLRQPQEARVAAGMVVQTLSHFLTRKW